MSAVTINLGNTNNSGSSNSFWGYGGTASKIGGVLTGLASAGSSAYSTYADVQNAKAYIDKAHSFMFRPLNIDDSYEYIKRDYSSWNPLSSVTKKDLGYSTSKGILNTISSAGAGASAGASFGGIGAAVGGVLGLGMGLAGLFAGKNKADREARKVNNTIWEVNDWNPRMLAFRYGNVKNQENLGLQANAYTKRGMGYADGGLIQSLNSKVLSPFGNRFDDGGPMDDYLHSNGSDWSNGFTLIGTGGSHELNPLGGVQTSVDSEGNPNLLEEGEVQYESKNNGTWAYSARREIPKDDAKALGLNWHKGMTFADGMIERLKIAGLMPYDPIELRGFDAFAMRLAGIQEREKQKELIKLTKQFDSNYAADGGLLNMNNTFSFGGLVLPNILVDAGNVPTYSFSKDVDFVDYLEKEINSNKDQTKALYDYLISLGIDLSEWKDNIDNFIPDLISYLNNSSNKTDDTESYTRALELLKQFYNSLNSLDQTIELERDTSTPAKIDNYTNIGRSTLKYNSKGEPIYPEYVKDGLLHKYGIEVLKNTFAPAEQEYMDYYINKVRQKAIDLYLLEHPEDKKLKGFQDPTEQYSIFNPTYASPSEDTLFYYEPSNLTPEQYKQNKEYYDGSLYVNTPLGTPQGRFRNPETGKIVNEMDVPEGKLMDWWEPIPLSDIVTDDKGVLRWDMLPAQQVLQAAYNEDPSKFNFYPKKEKEPEEPAKMPGVGLSPLRYWPIVDSAVLLGLDLFGDTNVIDFTNTNMLRNRLSSLDVPAYLEMQDFISPLPFARDYYTNLALALAGADRRGILGNVGGNRGAATQALLTQDLNVLNKLGDLGRAGQEYNRQDYLKVRDYNRQSKQFDADLTMKYNQMRLDAAKQQWDNLFKTVTMDDAMLNQVSLNRSTNRSNFAENMQGLGEDAHNLRMLQMLINSGYFGTTLDLAWRNYRQDYADWQAGRNNKNNLPNITVISALGGEIKTKRRKKHLTY